MLERLHIMNISNERTMWKRRSFLWWKYRKNYFSCSSEKVKGFQWNILTETSTSQSDHNCTSQIADDVVVVSSHFIGWRVSQFHGTSRVASPYSHNDLVWSNMNAFKRLFYLFVLRRANLETIAFNEFYVCIVQHT